MNFHERVQIVLMRHGIAMDRMDARCPSDADRPLTEEGFQKTRKAAAGLAALGIQPDRLISSPFTRALETGRLVARALEVNEKDILLSDTLLPDAPALDVFVEIKRLRARTVLLFGHAPHLDLALAHALGLARCATELKKAGAARLEMMTLSPPRGHLIWLMTAGQLRAIGRAG